MINITYNTNLAIILLCVYWAFGGIMHAVNSITKDGEPKVWRTADALDGFLLIGLMATPLFF